MHQIVTHCTNNSQSGTVRAAMEDWRRLNLNWADSLQYLSANRPILFHIYTRLVHMWHMTCVRGWGVHMDGFHETKTLWRGAVLCYIVHQDEYYKVLKFGKFILNDAGVACWKVLQVFPQKIAWEQRRCWLCERIDFRVCLRARLFYDFDWSHSDMLFSNRPNQQGWNEEFK